MANHIQQLCMTFLQANDWSTSFALLDEVCNRIAEDRDLAAHTNLGEYKFDIHKKVGLIDSLCEQHYATEFLQDQTAQANLKNYPWFFEDHYVREYTFIKSHVNETLRDVVHIGHGAIPNLSFVLQAREPDVHFTMIDIDPDVTNLARHVIEKNCPQMKVHFLTQDVTTYKNEIGSGTQLALMTNAPLIAFETHNINLDARYLFVRSATEAGSVLYPKLEIERLHKANFEVLAEKDDEQYGIHRWLVARHA